MRTSDEAGASETGARAFGDAMPAPDLSSATDSLLRKATGASATVALTVIDCASSERPVLVGVRSAATNRTHPGVISTPTQRIPHGLLGPLLEGVKCVAADASSVRFDVEHAVVRSNSTERHGHAIRYVVESLLARKLGVTDALERGDLVYHASVGSLTLGVAHYPNLPARDASERILMPNILVAVEKGVDCFPRSTASYDRLAWVDPKTLHEAMRTKDVFLLFPDGDPIELCIYGMCVATTTALLELASEVRS